MTSLTQRHKTRARAVTSVTAAFGAAVALAAPAHAAAYRTASDGAKITAVSRLAAQEYDLTIQSPALGQAVKTRVLVPKGWSADATRTWPVVYAFHGGNDNYTSWSANSDIATLAAKYQVIVVMPEGANGSYTDWYNYGKGGVPRWETFHTSEVLQLVERNFHAGASRAAIGDSSGGQGSMAYAARHKGMFKYAASFSGVLSLRSPGIQAMLILTNAGNKDPFAIWGIPGLDDKNWALHDPVALAPQLRGVRLFFSSGTTGHPGPGDPKVAPWDIGLLSEIAVGSTNKAFRDTLVKLGIPFTADIYGDGRHNWPAWIRETDKVWPSVMSTIGAKAD